VPISDSFVNALSIIGLWALSRKYIEQWFIWVVVDAIKVALYAYKGIPVKGSYYAISVVIAVLGYLKWRRMMQKRAANPTTC
jgi:nicotinamide mononucleotide transporter